MSDTPTPADVAQPAQDAPDKATTDGKPDVDWVAEARKWEQRAKENKATADKNKGAAERLAEIEAANQTEAEKAAARLSAAEKAAADATLSLARLEVALDKGLTPSQAKRLVGSSREELEADADELLKDLGEASKPRQPRPDPTQGRAPSGVPLDPRAADLAQIEADLKAAQRR